MEKAIEQAIKGGYRWGYTTRGHEVFYGDEQASVKLACQSAHLLDPNFWIALGKAEEWEGSTYSWQGDYSGKDTKWRVVWHHFIDYLADGGTPDEFFKKLLDK